MRKLLLILLGCSLGWTPSSAQTEASEVIELLYTADLPELYNTIEVNRVTYYKNGEYIKSENVARLPNFRFQIKENFGIKKGNRIEFDRDSLEMNHGKIPATVWLDNREFKAFIAIPTIVGIEFNNYTNKIKPVLNFWINVEAKFNSGKVFPLGVNQLILSTDIGTIEGNELLLPTNTDSIDYVTIEACLKSNPTMCIKQTLPIMHPDKNGEYEDDKELQEKKTPKSNSNLTDENSEKSKSPEKANQIKSKDKKPDFLLINSDDGEEDEENEKEDKEK